MTKVIHVAAGVIVNAQGQILIARRPEHTHQGGLWEFPGGKVEAPESVQQALARELHEELAIEINDSRPLICIRHDYSDKSVLLDVWKVTAFSGVPRGNEGQPIEWVAPRDLVNFSFPAANVPIVAAARLPERLAITGAASGRADYIEKVSAVLERGVSLLQLRAHHLGDSEYTATAGELAALCRRAGASLIANTSVGIYRHCDCDGLHLTGRRLMALQERPVPDRQWFGASCHSLEELRKAEALGADYVTLSPVLPTTTHPKAMTLGWLRFGEMTQQAKVPVFALGGMGEQYLHKVFDCGGQGVAAIGEFWPD